ncbi:CDP-glycerol glycerophosphotransferase family protein [Pseudomonas fragi]|uniref:CDP-glycerol glycerophosphotransferase family protein n=1 Tax=Pseudomonas fragi TaxID=296 RepID=UPI002005C9B9|nr:CDP-glycerol glycerophosphotransferase family protein [Pseudomonas fragi]MCK6254902.1 CDP-glycerol glycerophosphotransferase family protein [Pseudomonas fragi]
MAIIKSEKIIKILSLTYKTLALITPPQKNKICFFSEPDISDNAYHYFRYLYSIKPNLEYVWVVKKPKKALEKISTLYEAGNIKIVKKNTIASIFHLLRSKFIIHTHGTYRFVSPTSGRLIINLWHGMPIKKIGLLDDKITAPLSRIDRSDYIISTSKFFSYVMACAYKIEYKNSLITGLPRNDVLSTPVIPQKKVLEMLGVPEHHRIGFWLPTYRKISSGENRQDSTSDNFLSETNFNLEALDQKLLKLNTTIIIKTHPLDSFNYSKIGLSNIKLLTPKDWDATKLDLYDALSRTEFLISDISSVMIDYMLTGNPIIRIDPMRSGYSRGATYEFDFFNYTNFHEVRSESDLLLSLSYPKKKSTPPYMYHSSTGSASENITKFIFPH